MTTMDVKPIQTAYAGRLFRSRTEARWAVFYDALGLPWEYEKEGFELPTGWYLPDFWMPKQGCWIEIKGREHTEKELDFAGDLAVATGSTVYIFDEPLALPPSHFQATSAICVTSSYCEDLDQNIWGCDYGHCWCECEFCHAFGIQFNGCSDRLPCKNSEQKCRKSKCDENANSPALMNAYRKALSARFEHGHKQ